MFFSLSACLAAASHAGTLVGGGGQWKVRQVNSTFTPASIADAETALGGYKSIGERGVAVAQVDFGAAGQFGLNQPFPGLVNGSENFAVEVTGEIEVTSPGDISFGFFSDDWARLRIDGNLVAESAAVGQNTFGTVNLAAGVHTVELVYYEGLGSEELELFVATTHGTFNDFAAATWELLDATSSQAPADVTVSSTDFPVNAAAGAAVGDLGAVGGAGGPHHFAIVYPLDPAPVELVAAGASWRYLDTGVPAPAGWTTVGYDDSAWFGPGAGPLGYGDAAIATTTGFGPDANNKFPAYYFRHGFTLQVGELARVDSLRLRLLRDDGAAVYINGVEVLRNALPAGALDNTTLASRTAGGASEQVYYEFVIDHSMLVEGANVIAVEVHQAAVTSSDLIFDASLDYQRRSSLPAELADFDLSGNQLVLATAAASIPANISDTFDVPVRATNAYGASFEKTFQLTAVAAGSNPPTAIAIDSSNLLESAPAGTLVGTLSATDADAGDGHTFELVSAGFPDSASFTVSGSQLLSGAAAFDASVKATYDVRVRATDPAGATFEQTLQITITPAPARVAVTPNSLPENARAFSLVGTLSTDDPLSDTHTYRLVYPVDPTPVDLISFGDSWRYLDDGSDQGTAWAGSTFNDLSWATGAAPLGYGLRSSSPPDPDVAPTTVVAFGPNPDNKFATTYFRKDFTVADPNLVESLSFSLALDDGAIIYINGTPIVSIRAAGVDSFDDYTGQGDGGETTLDNFTLTGFFGDLLVAGQNVMAIEVHQSGPTSSDLWLDLSLSATVRTPNGDSDYFYMIGDRLFINRDLGDIPVTDGGSLTVQVESTSALGDVFTDDVTISVGPALTTPPQDIVLDNTSVNEVQPPGQVVGNLSSTDPDGGAFVYSLAADPSFPDNALFGIVGDQLVTATVLDADDAATRTVRVTTTDNTGLSFSKTFVISVNTVSQPPTAITVAPATFPVDAPVGTAIGTLDAVDGNASDTHTFAFGTWPDLLGAPILPFGSVWRYRDDGIDLGDTWRQVGTDDSLWPQGAAELGYGDGDEVTTVGFVDTDPVAPDIQKNATTYFRHTVSGVTPTGGQYQLSVRYDDAVAVYINGIEVYRSPNLVPGATATTFATVESPDNTLATINLAPGVIAAGDNVVAVEIHQANPTSSDISFDLEIRPFVASPFPSYFAINGDQLETAGNFPDLGLGIPFTFEVPIIASDPSGNDFEMLVLVTMTGGGSDTDGDGLPDAWEEANFGVGNLSQGPGDDPDGDGDSNAEEYAAGTDPNDPGDFLQITRVEIVAGDAQVTWPAKAGHTYALYWSGDLSGGSWQLVQGGLTVASDGDLTGTDTGVPVPGARSYRVEATVTPAP